MGTGTFQNAGVTYTVLLGPAGRYLPSGPAAYLFDDKARFVDWTSDMGDFYTVKYRFDLTSGRVKGLRRELTSARSVSQTTTNRISTEADAIAVVLADVQRQGGDRERKECSAKHIDGNWWVTAWHISYPNNVGSSRFVPGGFTTYVVSTNGTILRTVPGK